LIWGLDVRFLTIVIVRKSRMWIRICEMEESRRTPGQERVRKLWPETY
jgi:hypothetical protein